MILLKHAAIRLLKQNPNVALKSIVQKKLSKVKNYQMLIRLLLIFLRDSTKNNPLWTILHSRTTQVQGTRGELFKRSSGSIFL